MANQFLALSLFIMMLSFFIVLNALSNFEEVKSRPVLNSISLAFSSKEVGEDSASSFEDSLERAFNEGDAIDRLNALFKSQIAGYEAQQNRLGTVMHVRLPTRNFERAVMAASQSGIGNEQAYRGLGGAFLPVLVSVLRSDETGVPYRMDIFVNTKRDPAEMQNEEPAAVSTTVQRIGMYAQRLEEAGLPKKLLSIGLQEGEEGYIDLFFRRHEPFNPLGAETVDSETQIQDPDQGGNNE